MQWYAALWQGWCQMLTMVPGMALSVNSIAFYPDAQEAKPNVFVRIMCKRLGVLATPRVNPDSTTTEVCDGVTCSFQKDVNTVCSDTEQKIGRRCLCISIILVIWATVITLWMWCSFWSWFHKNHTEATPIIDSTCGVSLQNFSLCMLMENKVTGFIYNWH